MPHSQQLQSRTIDYLRLPLAVLIVLAHTAALGVNSSHPVYSTLCIVIRIARIATPCFFLFSGYFFFSRLEGDWDTEAWIAKLKKKVRTLLVPYILWNIIAAVAIWGYRWTFAKAHGSTYPGFIEHITAWGGLWDQSSALPFDGPLWFLRYLIVFSIAAPVFWLFIKYTRIFGIALLTLAFLCSSVIPEGVVFFGWGAWFRISGKNFLDEFNKARWAALILLILTVISLLTSSQRIPELYEISKKLFILPGIIFTMLLAGRGIASGVLKTNAFLTEATFFIYASHNILILHDFSHWAILHLLPFRGEWMECLDLFLRPAVAVLICLGLYWLMNKITPRTLALLTGGR